MKTFFAKLSRFGSFLFLLILLLFISGIKQLSAQGCKGLVSAGPDLFTCDPSMMVQLQGMINGSPNEYQWTPSVGLSNDKVLDPMVTIKTPGKYKFKLSAQVVGTTNYIVNGNFEGGFSGFSTEYVFKTLGQGFGPNNAAIATNPQAYNSGFVNCGDHTSGSSNMWLIDGSTAPGTKVWCQTVLVTPGNSYQFELYSMSVFPVSPGILDIKVNGTSIGGGQVGGMCDWSLMMACFKATTGTATICISEVTGVGYGDDFAIDDIALYEKCTDEDEVEVEIVDLTAKIAIATKPKCSSDIFDLFGTGSSVGPNITYEWSTDMGTIISENGLSIKARGSGKYTIKVKYDNGSVHCEKEENIDVNAPDKLEGIMTAFGTANCALDSILINVNMTSGSGVYTYNWSPSIDILNGNNSENVRVNKAQNYKVTITDANSGCQLELNKSVLADTTIPKFTLNGDSLLNCINKNIVLNSSILDTSLYFLSWTLPNKQVIIQNPKINSTQSGNYILKVQNKLNKCIDSAKWQVFIDTIRPIINLSADTTIDCINQIATIIASNAGNIKDNKYFWTLTSGQFLTEDSILIKTSGIGGYTILRTLNTRNGCTDIDSIFIKDKRSFPNLSLLKPDTLNCLNRTTPLTSSSSNPNNLKINWTTLNGNILSGSNTFDAIANKKGKYYIKFEDTTNHCSVFDSTEVFENIQIPSAVLGTDIVLKCSDTTIIIDGSNSSTGTNYDYLWTSPNGNIKSGQTTNTITVDKAGKYFLVVIDKNNFCRDSSSINVINDINKPNVTISIPAKLNCKTKLINLNAIANSPTGGNLTYKWTANNNQIIQNNDKANPGITIPGTYTVEVIDQNNGCSSSAQVLVDIDTISPVANAGKNQTLTCKIVDISIDGILSSNGNQYNYIWSSANGNFITTADPKIIKTKTPGIYNLKVINTDNGCEANKDVIIYIDTTKPLIVLTQPDTLNCLINTVSLFSTGSSIGNQYQIAWSSPNGNILDPLNLSIVKVNKKGLYTFTIIDTLNGCSDFKSIQVVEDLNQPIISLTKPSMLTCKIRSVDLNINVTNNINSTILWSSPNGNIISANNLANAKVDKEGWYFVKVTNKNGCSSIDSVLVSEIKNIPNRIDLDISQAHCQNEESILQNLFVNGGIGPYTYELDNKSVFNFPVSGLQAGLHNLKVIDKNGCELSTSFNISNPPVIQASLPAEAKIDAGSSYNLLLTTNIPNDSIESIVWTPSTNLNCTDCLNPTIVNLQDDTEYTVTITDKNGCFVTTSIKIKIIKRGVWVPNVFSPNGDNINDLFYPFAIDDSYKTIKLLHIYDRWGALIFSNENFKANDPKSGWDGNFKNQALNPGVYTYFLKIEWNSGDFSQLQGDLTLIR